MLRRILGATVLLAGLAAPALAVENPLVVDMGGSAGTGSVLLFQSAPGLMFNVQMQNDVDGARTTVVDGSCSHPGRSQYVLTSTDNGKSKTLVADATLATLVAKPTAVVIRKSGAADAPIVACGNIKG